VKPRSVRSIPAWSLLVSASSTLAAARWETLPPTPAPVASTRAGHADVNGIRLYYGVIGHGPPVLLVH
jgi:hypothetical protein